MLNLNDGCHHPYKKPNEETNYIHVNSNHPLIHFGKISNVNRKRLYYEHTMSSTSQTADTNKN